MKKNIREELNKIEIPDELGLKIKEGIEKSRQELNFDKVTVQERRLRKRAPVLVKFLIATASCFVLFFISAFFHPSAASVAAKIPFIGPVFEERTLMSIVEKELEEQGYKYEHIGISYSPEKNIEIFINDSKYYMKMKNDIKSDIEKVLKTHDYDNSFLVVVSKQEEPSQIPTDHDTESSINLFNTLKEQGYNVLVIGINDENEYQVDIVDTETRTDEIKDIIAVYAKENKIDQYSVSFRKVNLKELEQAHKWDPVLHQIGDRLMGNKKYKVTEIAYSNSNKPYTIYISTTLKENNEDDEKLGQILEQAIEEYIQSESIQNVIGRDEYEIVIYNKKRKKIN